MSIDERTPELEEGRMTLAEHLAELRSRLIKVVVAVALGSVVAFVFREQILDFLLFPLEQVDVEVEGEASTSLIVTDPLETFNLAMKLSGYGGILLAMPVILWQLWRFITPGLYAHEKRLAVPFVASALTLFVLGAGLAYWTMPKALTFLQTIVPSDNIEYLYTPANYSTFALYMMVAFGIGFEFPIILVFLQMAGLLQPTTLSKGRPYAIVGIFVLVAVITPSGDPISLLALALPMCLFYELSIIIGKIFVRRRRRRDEAALADGS
jgi:sec-independent protein translocase protein TatC